MEDKYYYPIFAFNADGGGRYGIILVAAKDEKEAFNYLMTTRYSKLYQIKFEKKAINLCHCDINELKEPKIVFKNFIEI